MNDPRDLIRNEAKERARAVSIAAHESTVTRRILTRLAPGLPLAQLAAEQSTRQLNLAMVRAYLPTFPLHLFAQSTAWLHEVKVSDLLGGDLLRTPIFRAYSEHLVHKALDDARDFAGLVTPWPQATAVVLHNWPHMDETVDRHKAHGRFTFISCRRGSPIVYTIEPLDSLLTALEKAGVCQR